MRVIVAFALLVISGCLTMPEPGPMKSITYEFDKDSHKWTEEECTTSSSQGPQGHFMRAVCYKRTLAEAPPGIDPQSGER
jgi:hypothetical protein